MVLTLYNLHGARTVAAACTRTADITSRYLKEIRYLSLYRAQHSRTKNNLINNLNTRIQINILLHIRPIYFNLDFIFNYFDIKAMLIDKSTDARLKYYILHITIQLISFPLC